MRGGHSVSLAHSQSLLVLRVKAIKAAGKHWPAKRQIFGKWKLKTFPLRVMVRVYSHVQRSCNAISIKSASIAADEKVGPNEATIIAGSRLVGTSLRVAMPLIGAPFRGSRLGRSRVEDDAPLPARQSPFPLASHRRTHP